MEPTATTFAHAVSLDATIPTLRPATPAEKAATYDDFPVLRARPHGLAEGLANRLDGRHPVTVFLAVVLSGYVVLTGLLIGLGLLLTRVILPIDSVARTDERFERWLVAHRTSGRTEASLVGSIGAGGVTLPIVIAVVLIVFCSFRRWRIAAFMLMTLLVESGAYRVTTIFVHRHRPEVARLETLPVNASFPSGHTAASIAVYGGLALLLTSRVRNTAFRIAVWAVAILTPVFVGVSRMYRGMHHPLDTIAGGLLGIAALLIVMTAARTAGVVVSRRRHSRFEAT